MNVVGLDLSLTATGIAYADGTTFTVGTDSALTAEERLGQIISEIGFAVEAICDPADLIVIEDFVTRSPAASSLGMVHGAVRWWLFDNYEHIPRVVVPPAILKKYATGKGNATKADMRVALLQRTGRDMRDDNQVDAWWLRAMGLDHLGEAPVKLPEAQRAMLAKVAWPDREAVG